MSVRSTQRKDGKLKVITTCNEITAYTLRLVCNENLFHKRSRWLIAGKIADVANDFHTAVHKANEINVKTRQEAMDRHRLQTLAVSYLYALDAKMEMAVTVLQIDEDRLEHWAGLVNEELKLLSGWISRDEKRYSGLQ